MGPCTISTLLLILHQSACQSSTSTYLTWEQNPNILELHLEVMVWLSQQNYIIGKKRRWNLDIPKTVSNHATITSTIPTTLTHQPPAMTGVLEKPLIEALRKVSDYTCMYVVVRFFPPGYHKGRFKVFEGERLLVWSRERKWIQIQKVWYTGGESCVKSQLAMQFWACWSILTDFAGDQRIKNYTNHFLML